MSRSRCMRFAVFVQGTGNHIAGWRLPGASDNGESLAVMQNIAATAERGLFDLLFVSDGLATKVKGDHPSFVARLEPTTLLAALAVTTRHLGLGGTMSTTYSDPFTTARAFASLDHLSQGRAAWNAVTSSAAAAAANFSRAGHPEHDHRYEIAEEFVDVVKGLWDCWEDDALPRNRETGLFVDPAKVRTLDHVGRYFQVKGPLNMSRCPSGHPVIIQAGASAAGQNFAARTADVVFTVVQDLVEARRHYAGFKALLPRFGRQPEHCHLLPGVMPFIAESDAAAKALLDQLQGFLDAENALALVSARIGHDLSGYPLDGPVPELPPTDMSHAFAQTLMSAARRDNMTLRDLYNLVAAARGHWVIYGSPTRIADIMEEWFLTGAADGFVVLPPWFPGQFDAFVDQVIPILQQRGLYRTAYEGTTLRENLGLPRPGSHRGVGAAAQ
ncbi:LLM class flavin-dependent oxidoreductase [Siccirubricoccus phaeus]|uniref:LLM class flavin-dependent oxidoreductase n=1 Tax=Siccirubricoccus phaeus TaxID=2595053 RepID=UPI0011F11206|nr:LLM class flavin-dependent oxidoreductase [Siccirubricoccus phaeus]